MARVRTFPGFDELHRLGQPPGHVFRVRLEKSAHDALVSFARGSGVRPTEHAQWAMGSSKPGDVIWTTSSSPMLLSERVVDILFTGHFSGWTVAPVDVEGKRGEALPTYYLLVVQGTCGRIDYSRSEVIQKEYPGGMFPVFKGMYFDEATWDGSDLFSPARNGSRVITETLRRAWHKARVRNICYDRLDQCEAPADFYFATVTASGDIEEVRALLASGLDPNIGARMPGGGALVAAASRRLRDRVLLLLSAGADPNLAPETGHTPLMAAASVGADAIVADLLAAGVQLDAIDTRDGSTALHLAARGGHQSVVERLLTSGANPMLRDSAGLLPRDVARSHGHVRVQAHLLGMRTVDEGI